MKYPWINTEDKTPEQVERIRWNMYEQEKAKKRMKHDKNLPEDCQGCSIGAKWTNTEVLILVNNIVSMTKAKKQSRILLADLCRATNRSASGILSKLNRMGLTRRAETGFSYIPMRIMSRKRSEELAFNSPDVVSALMANGWVLDKLKRLVAPAWWEFVHFDRRGIGPSEWD